MSDDAFDEEFQAAADTAYAELLERVGESSPQPRLDATRRAVELLGDPQRSAPVVHITGTNGKTSTSRMIESLLRATGLRTGLLTSPHLLRVNERIMIDGVPITNEAFSRNWDDIRPYLLMVDAELVANGAPALSFFEALTVLAFASFADAPVDVIVLEVGMGGEWDSTNVADGQVAVFTPIALDHMARLGRTVSEIARTKSGIIKPAASVVTAIQSIEALDELRAAAQHNEAPLAIERVDFALESTTVAVGGQVIDVRGRAGRYADVFLPLYGDHQAQNAAIAIAAVESFFGDGTRPLDQDVVVEGLGGVTSPGRLQLVGIEPTVLIDAAHNPHGAASLTSALTEYFDFDEFAVVLGILADKDAHGIVSELSAIASRFYATQSESDRAIPADELAELVGEQVDRDAIFAATDAADAIEAARVWAAESPRRAVVVTGSITLVADALALALDGGLEVSEAPTRRPRRARGITESLLSIVLVLEAILLFFVSLTAFGLHVLPAAAALGGGLGLIAVFLIVSLLQRYRWGIAIGWVLQGVVIALGILVPLMYVVGAGFAAIWVYCYLKARQIEKQNRGAQASHDQGGPA